jgi:hypothetical protein
MTGRPPEYQPEHEQARSHEMDLLDLTAAKRKTHHARTVERLHGYEIPDHQEDEHDE